MNVVDIKLMKTIDGKFSSPYKNEESDNILKKYSRQLPEDIRSFYKFKRGCLKNKFPLYECEYF